MATNLNQRQTEERGAEVKKALAKAKKEKGAKEAAAEEGPKRTGRRKKGEPYATTLKAANGASVTVKFRKAEVEPGEVAEVLEEVLRKLAAPRQAAAG